MDGPSYTTADCTIMHMASSLATARLYHNSLVFNRGDDLPSHKVWIPGLAFGGGLWPEDAH